MNIPQQDDEDFPMQNKINQLFVDPSSESASRFASENAIILKPQFIWDLVDYLDEIDDNKKISVLLSLRGFLDNFAINSLSLVNRQNNTLAGNSREGLLEVLIKKALVAFESGSERVIQNYLALITMLYHHNKLQKSHLTRIYSVLSKKFYEKELNSDLLFYTFRLLRSVLSIQSGKNDYPTSFFYFTGVQSSIKVLNTQPTYWPFNSGFAFSVWFYLEGANKVVHTVNNNGGAPKIASDPKLLTVFCNGTGGIELYFKESILYYRLIGTNYDEEPLEAQKLMIGEFSSNTWYYLGIEHEPQGMLSKAHLNIIINDEPKRTVNMDYPKFNNFFPISKFIIAENLVGRISSLFLFKSSIGPSRLSEIYNSLRLGVQDDNSIRGLNTSIQKVVEKVFLMYTPIRAENDKCFDIFNSMHGVLAQNSGFTLNNFRRFRLKSLGGMTSILPLFYLLRFVDTQKHDGTLNELWKLLIVLLKDQVENQIEAQKIGLFKIIGQLLSESKQNFFTWESIEFIAELRNSLNGSQLEDDMFVNLLWKADIYIETNEEIRNEIWAYIRTIYLQNPRKHVALFSVKDILDLIADKYDGLFKKKTFENYNKEWNSTKTSEFKKAELVMGSLFGIIEAILFTGGDSVSEEIIPLIRILTYKCSAYFHFFILKILMNIMTRKRTGKGDLQGLYVKILIDNKILQGLLYLLSNTNCLDIKATCIKFLNLLIDSRFMTMSETQITNYILEKVWSPSSLNKDAIEFDSNDSNPRSRGPTRQLSLTKYIQNPSVYSPKKGGIEGPLSARLEQLSANKVGSPYTFGQVQGNEHKPRMSVQFDAIPSPTLGLKPKSLPDADSPGLKQPNDKEKEKLSEVDENKSIDDLEENKEEDEEKRTDQNPEIQKEEVVEEEKVNEETTTVEVIQEDQNIETGDLIKLDLEKIQRSQSSPSTIKLPESDYEPLYTSLLEWLLNKSPASIEGSVMIDDTDKIKSINIVFIILRIFRQAPESVKQKIIQDLYMLIKCNLDNCELVLQYTEFQYFLLDTLYRYQLSLYESELQGDSIAIWEITTKTYILLMRHSLVTDGQGWKNLQKLFIWMENKRNLTANRFDSNKYEQAIYYLIRHLWLHLLESLENEFKMMVSLKGTIIWENLVQIIFYTKEFITSAYNASILSAANAEFEEKNILQISNFIKKISPNEPYPLNFQSLLSNQKSLWVDFNLCETLLKHVRPLWSESIFSQAGIVGSASETQKLEKKIHNLLDIKQSEEQSKILFILLEENSIEKTSGSFLKIIVQLMTCYLEDVAKNGLEDSVMFICKEIEQLTKFLLIACENVEEKSIDPKQHNFLIATVMNILKFLYEIYTFIPQEKIKPIILASLKRIFMHLLCEVDYLSRKTGNFTYLSEVRGSLQGSPSKEGGVKRSFTLITFDLVLNYIIYEKESLINTQFIKTMKLEDFAYLDKFILSKEWKLALTNNEKINKIVNDHYGGSFYTINNKIYKRIQDQAYEQVSLIMAQEKAREQVGKNIELQVIDIATEIYEQETQQRHIVLAKEEEGSRSAKNSWRKIWKKQRIFIGQWTHPEFYDQQDTKFSLENESFANMSGNKFFSHKIAKYETRSRARPFLKVKLLEPEYVKENNQFLEDNGTDMFNIINSLNSSIFFRKNVTLTDLQKYKKDMLSPVTSLKKKIENTSNSSQEKNEKINKKLVIPPNIDDSKRLLNKSRERDEDCFIQKCQWIKSLTIRQGYLQLTGHTLKFVLEGLDQQESHIAFMKHSLPSHREISKEWSVGWIREIQRRRYIYRKTALEIFLIDGSTLFFNFPDGGIEDILFMFAKMRRFECYNLIYYGSFDTKKILEKSLLTKRWMNHEISNFEYLIHLNALACRSYKDLTQYPVFPWILNDFSSTTIELNDTSYMRDLSKTMGSMGSQERIQTFLERFGNVDPFNPVARFHFGSHYSSPAIILQFLIRLAPYTQGAIQLQSGKFDLPDRLFHSLEESFKGATEEISDVRELVPEFFCLPDFLTNREKLDFGVTQSGYRVHHVTPPRWSGQNPYRFVAMMRTALESESVSRALHNWIDLIFGYKNSGKEAEKALNMFYYMTYEDSIDLDSITDPITKTSYEAQIVHFGQTPLQLFNKPHPQRYPLAPPYMLKPISETLMSFRIYKSYDKKVERNPESTFPTVLTNNGISLIKLKVINESQVVGLRENGKLSYFKYYTSPVSVDINNTTAFKFGIEKEKAVKFNKRKFDYFDNIDPSVVYTSHPYTFIDSGKIIAAGGYWDGRLTLFSVEKDMINDSYYYHSDTITAIAAAHDDTFLVTGTKSGECAVWIILSETQKLSLKTLLFDHSARINNICISDELGLFGTASDDGKINLYHSISGKIFRTIHHPHKLPVNMVNLSASPLPCIVFFSSQNSTLYSYSINGRFLESVVESSRCVLSATILKDLNFLELLVYGNEKGELYVRELPFLDFKRKFDIAANTPIYSISVSKDRKYIFCGLFDGEFVFLADPNTLLLSQLKSNEDSSDSSSSWLS